LAIAFLSRGVLMKPMVSVSYDGATMGEKRTQAQQQRSVENNESKRASRAN
jgi:hypothetical protein